MYRLEVVT